MPVPSKIVHELYQHAVDAEPEECCGLIVGHSLERYLRSVRCQNIMTTMHDQDPIANPRDGRSAFYMNPREYDQVDREAQRAGQGVTAVYHSHVGAGPYLSEMDLAYAEQSGFPFPDADQIVLSVYEGVVRDVALFRRTANGFVGHRVEPVDA